MAAASVHANTASPAPSSSRSSLDQSKTTPASSSATSVLNAGPNAAVATSGTRRNRTALRDYYNLPAANSSTSTVETTSNNNTNNDATTATDFGLTTDKSPLAALDQSPFDADNYIESLLASSTLQELMQVQATLAGETRGLDGEGKGLVYDNYGRLIGARDVVQKIGVFLSASSDDQTSTAALAHLEPADPSRGVGAKAIADLREGVEALAPMVAGLTRKTAPTLPSRRPNDDDDDDDSQKTHTDTARQQRDLVRQVLATPAHLRQLVSQGRGDEAGRVWRDTEALLDAWGRETAGVAEVRRRSEAALAGAGC